MKAGVEEEDDRRGVTGGSDEDDEIGDEEDGSRRKRSKGSDERLAARLKEDAAEVGFASRVLRTATWWILVPSMVPSVLDIGVATNQWAIVVTILSTSID